MIADTNMQEKDYIYNFVDNVANFVLTNVWIVYLAISYHLK